MTPSNLPAGHNDLVNLYTAQEAKLHDYEQLVTTLLMSGCIDDQCSDLIKELRAKYK